MPVVLIVSKDADFSGVVAEAAAHELGVEAVIAESAEKARALAGNAQAIVASEALPGKWPLPVIVAGKPPLKLSGLLAALRRTMGKKQEIKLGKTCSFSLREKTVTHLSSGQSARLTDKEASLLTCLAAAGGKNVSKETLLKSVWDTEAELETHMLETHIYRLRAKLEEAGVPAVIAASGGGYSLKVK